MNEKNGPGQPKKKQVINKHLLRFRANYPNLKKKLKNMAKETGNSLNDYLIEVLNNYVKKYDPININELEELEQNLGYFFQNIDLKIQDLQSRYLPNIPSIIETHDFKKVILNCFSNPLEREIFYLNLICCQIQAEEIFLTEILTENYSIYNKEKESVVNYIDYYCKKNDLDDSTDSKKEKISVQIIYDFYNVWFLQLTLYHIIKKKTNFEVDITELEDFIFSVLYPDLKIEPLLKIIEFKHFQKRWDKIIKEIKSKEGKIYSEFNLKNINFIKALLNKLEFKYFASMGLTSKEWAIFRNEKDFINSNLGREYFFLKILSYKVERIENNYYKKSHLSSYSHRWTFLINKKPTEYTKKDFLSYWHYSFNLDFHINPENKYSLIFFLERLIKDYPIELKTSIMDYFKHIEFKPFIVKKVLNLEEYFNYLNKNKD